MRAITRLRVSFDRKSVTECPVCRTGRSVGENPFVPSDADRQAVVGEFDAALYPSGAATLTEAALGIYQVLMWYDDVAHVLHVNESNELQKRAWAQRAQLAEDYLATQLGIPAAQVPLAVDRMMKLARWTHPLTGKPVQRQNPLGNGLRILIAEVLRRWGNPNLEYAEEVDAANLFPGITLPGRSTTPKIDVLILKARRPRGIVSCKWSIRHDRISDPTNECTSYKAAAIQQQITDLEYFVVSNEFSAARLDKVLGQPCVNGLIHVHSPLFETIAGPQAVPVVGDPKFLDLIKFVQATHSW
jgi:hypothetical protein